MRALYSMTNQIRQIIHRSKLENIIYKMESFSYESVCKGIIKKYFHNQCATYNRQWNVFVKKAFWVATRYKASFKVKKIWINFCRPLPCSVN